MAGGGVQDELWAAAAEAAAERRGRSAGVSAQEQWEGVLAWERPPVAGATATVLYNKDSGALRSTSHPTGNRTTTHQRQLRYLAQLFMGRHGLENGEMKFLNGQSTLALFGELRILIAAELAFF